MREIIDPKGSVLHFFRNDDADFSAFGECYFSEVKPGVVKAWKLHQIQTQNFIVPVGKIKLVLCDLRENSKSHGLVSVIELGRPDCYSRIKIPSGIYYGFQGISKETALIVNFTDTPHDPKESTKLDQNDVKIPYVW
ncbi:dTDP-4-dehydrorhamnose 3,5-epimerase [Leptospira idonii]|uniref:dTDP-4-dehydrorhamnose 3,5-epimerase n=2 Tax=Leptospira idonii TaxID=1193500 RepID=A0A4R9LWX3_9LEPT|nr:dTDP-4-dehydrorhamnose 3,5-epimerase [Leptospira idonii]